MRTHDPSLSTLFLSIRLAENEEKIHSIDDRHRSVRICRCIQ